MIKEHCMSLLLVAGYSENTGS